MRVAWLALRLRHQRLRPYPAANALQHSEKLFRSFARLSTDWYWEQDAQFRYVRAEAAYGSMDEPARSRLMGQTAWDMPSAGLDHAAWQVHRQVLAAYQVFRNFEVQRELDQAKTAAQLQEQALGTAQRAAELAQQHAQAQAQRVAVRDSSLAERDELLALTHGNALFAASEFVNSGPLGRHGGQVANRPNSPRGAVFSLELPPCAPAPPLPTPCASGAIGGFLAAFCCWSPRCFGCGDTTTTRASTRLSASAW